MLRIDSFTAYLGFFHLWNSSSTQLKALELKSLHSKEIVLSVEMKFIGYMSFKAFESIPMDASL